MAKNITPVADADVTVAATQQAIVDAIAAQRAKAETVARKGRMQYAIAALSQLGVDLGLFTVESSTKAAEPKVLLTDREKAQRIVERNATRGWRTSPAVQLVADGEAETFEIGKQLAAAQAATAEKPTPIKRATPAPKPSAKKKAAAKS